MARVRAVNSIRPMVNATDVFLNVFKKSLVSGGMMMRMADTNKDGAITRAEFVGASMKHFDMTDANKDGSVTPDERKAAMQKMREHMKEMRGKMGARPAPAPAN